MTEEVGKVMNIAKKKCSGDISTLKKLEHLFPSFSFCEGWRLFNNGQAPIIEFNEPL